MKAPSTLDADQRRFAEGMKNKFKGVYKNDYGANRRIIQDKPTQQELARSAKLKSLAGSAAGAAAMGTTIVMGMVTAKTVDHEDTSEQIAGTVATMAPMLGTMFGPWGAAIGSLVGIASGIFTWLNETDSEKRQKILDEAKEANEILSVHL